MPRAPRTRLIDAFDRLRQVNEQEAALRREKEINQGGLVGAVAGAGLAVATGGASLPAIAAGANVGSQVGRAARGGRLDPVALSTGIMSAADAMDRAQRVESERNLLGEIAPPPQVNLDPADIPEGAGTTRAIPGLGEPLPEGARPDAYSRVLSMARESSSPMQTAAQGLQLLKAAQPPPATPDKPKGSPRQVWVNEAPEGQDPKWIRQSVTNDTQFGQLVDQYGQRNVLTQNPEPDKGERSTEFERMSEYIIELGEKRRDGGEITDNELARENLYRQKLSRPISFFDPQKGPVTQPGLTFKELDALGRREPEAAGTAPAQPPAEAQAGSRPPLPTPQRIGETPASTEKTRSDAQAKIVAAREQRARLTEIRSSFKPEFLQIGHQAWVGGLKLAERAGFELSPESRQQITEMTTFKQRSIENLNLYIKEITGAQMSEAEADRLRQAMPDADNDSPTEFLAKYDAIVENGKRAEARYERLLKEGAIQPGDPITEDLARQNPLLTKEDPARPVSEQDYNALPSGAFYVDPDDPPGSPPRIKP